MPDPNVGDGGAARLAISNLRLERQTAIGAACAAALTINMHYPLSFTDKIIPTELCIYLHTLYMLW